MNKELEVYGKLDIIKTLKLGGNRMKKYLAILMMAVALTFGCVTTQSSYSVIMTEKIEFSTFKQIHDVLDYAVKNDIKIVDIDIFSRWGHLTNVCHL